MDVEILSDLGLSNAEIKIYLALLESGTSKAGLIIRKTGLQNSVVHSTLPKLAEKGFVSYIVLGGIKVYSATDPKNILKFIETKKERFERILPELLIRQKPKIPQSAEVYDGFKGLKVLLYELIKGTKKGDEFLFFAFDVKNTADFENVYEFYRSEYQPERAKKGLVVKGLAPKRLKSIFEKAGWTKKKVKFTDFPIPTNISVVNDKVVFTPWEDEKISFLISSRQLADSFRQYFYSIWDQL